jgi:5-methylcytosine-specific restriction enzyme A
MLVLGGGYCPQHALKQKQSEREQDQLRGSASARGYTSRWRKASQTFLKRNPLCVLCEAQGEIVAAELTDHIVPHRMSKALESGDRVMIAAAQTLFWDQENWQALCWSCHSIKTAREDGGFGHPALRKIE